MTTTRHSRPRPGIHAFPPPSPYPHSIVRYRKQSKTTTLHLTIRVCTLPLERRQMMTLPKQDFEDMLERAAERGARHALHEVGLDGADAATSKRFKCAS